MTLEEDLLEWANSKVESSKINNFSDDSLSHGLYLLLLLDNLSDSVDWSICGDDHEFNCRYCIEVASQLLIPRCITWKDISEVNSRKILLFVSTLKQIYQEGVGGILI